MAAADDLKRIEETTDWQALVDLALAVPPNPGPLLHAGSGWASVFSVVYHGPPLEADYPEPVRAFFRRLAWADVPPELIEWVERFESKHSRKPKLHEIPKRLRLLIPGDRKAGGRPRIDTKRWRDAAAAWTAAVFRESYEARRDTISFFKRAGGFKSLFGFSIADVRGDRPSSLALEKLAEEAGLSRSRLADIMGHRRKKK